MKKPKKNPFLSSIRDCEKSFEIKKNLLCIAGKRKLGLRIGFLIFLCFTEFKKSISEVSCPKNLTYKREQNSAGGNIFIQVSLTYLV